MFKVYMSKRKPPKSLKNGGKTVPLISGRRLGHQPSEGGVNRGPKAPGTKKYPRKRPYKNDK
jgi:hypothetical protein